MKQLTFVALTLTAALSTGCASMNRPSEADIASLPVVSFGQTPPEGGEFVLRFPAGTPISTPVEFSGDLFTGPDQKMLTVTPAVDIYSYKNWVSFDGHNWEDGRKALDVKLDMVLPGYHHPEPGFLNMVMNRKAN